MLNTLTRGYALLSCFSLIVNGCAYWLPLSVLPRWSLTLNECTCDCLTLQFKAVFPQTCTRNPCYRVACEFAPHSCKRRVSRCHKEPTILFLFSSKQSSNTAFISDSACLHPLPSISLTNLFLFPLPAGQGRFPADSAQVHGGSRHSVLWDPETSRGPGFCEEPRSAAPERAAAAAAQGQGKIEKKILFTFSQICCLLPLYFSSRATLIYLLTSPFSVEPH